MSAPPEPPEPLGEPGVSPSALRKQILHHMLALAVFAHVRLLSGQRDRRQSFELGAQRMAHALADLALIASRLGRLAGAAPAAVRMGRPKKPPAFSDVRMTGEGAQIGAKDVRMGEKVPRRRGGQPGNTNRLVHGRRSKAAAAARAEGRRLVAEAARLARSGRTLLAGEAAWPP